MSQVSGPFATGASGGRAHDEVTEQLPLAVYSCSRIGRVANPPGFSFSDWFRWRRGTERVNAA
jgi:hypothetical protein